MSLPVVKLAGLVVKTLSKPLSKFLKGKAEDHETLRRGLVGIGNIAHQLTARCVHAIASQSKVPHFDNENASEESERCYAFICCDFRGHVMSDSKTKPFAALSLPPPLIVIVTVHARRLSILSSGYSIRSVPNPSKSKALQKGSDIFGETVVLTVAGTIIVLEYNMSAAKAKRKEEEKFKSMLRADVEIKTEIAVLKERLDRMEKRQGWVLNRVRGGDPNGGVEVDKVREKIQEEIEISKGVKLTEDAEEADKKIEITREADGRLIEEGDKGDTGANEGVGVEEGGIDEGTEGGGAGIGKALRNLYNSAMTLFQAKGEEKGEAGGGDDGGKG